MLIAMRLWDRIILINHHLEVIKTNKHYQHPKSIVGQHIRVHKWFTLRMHAWITTAHSVENGYISPFYYNFILAHFYIGCSACLTSFCSFCFAGRKIKRMFATKQTHKKLSSTAKLRSVMHVETVKRNSRAILTSQVLYDYSFTSWWPHRRQWFKLFKI